MSATAAERYTEIVNNFLAPALGNLQLAKLNQSHIQDAYNGWASGGRLDGKAGGLAPRTRRHLHRILSAALARAVENQLIARNSCDVFRKRLLKVERREMATLSAEQSARLLEAVRHSHIYWPVLIALATGARRGEVLAIRWRNVDLDRGTVVRRIQHNGGEWSQFLDGNWLTGEIALEGFDPAGETALIDTLLQGGDGRGIGWIER